MHKNFSTYAILLIAWMFICLLGGLETLLIFIFRPEVIQSDKFYWLPVMRIVNGFASISIVLYPGHLLIKNLGVTLKVLGYFILMIVFVLVYLIFSVGQFQLAFLSVSTSLLLAGIGETIMTDLHHIVSYYLFLLFIILGKEYFEEKTSAIIRKEQIESLLNKTQLKVLQQQIQPHFLFNTLNNVIAIIDERKKAAQEMLVDLSELLRRSVALDFSKKITLENELTILKSYLAIEKKRFEHQLHYDFNVDKDCLHILVPPFLLQPLFENAIKHGFKGGVEEIKIATEIHLESDYVFIRVTNNGAPISNASFGVGLTNTRERLENAYMDDFQLQLKEEDGLVINSIKIPIR